MKILIFSFTIVAISTFSFAQDYYDTTATIKSFQKIYDQNIIRLDTDFRGLKWKELAPIFEPSVNGKLLYQKADKQRKAGLYLGLTGLGMFLEGSILANRGYKTKNKGLQTTGLALFFGSGPVNIASLVNTFRSMHSFEKAVWVRNEDVFSAQLPLNSQAVFRQFYEQQTMYFAGSKMVLNGLKFRPSSANSSNFFNTSDLSLDLYNRYRNNNRIANFLYFGGVATVFLSLNANNLTSFTVLYFGGAGAVIASFPLQFKASLKLRQAVSVRNRDVLLKRFP